MPTPEQPSPGRPAGGEPAFCWDGAAPLPPGAVAPGAGVGRVNRPDPDHVGSVDPTYSLLKFPPVGPAALVRLFRGKLRRALLGRVLKGVTRRRHALRRGQCVRCGACCQLGRVCPSLAIEPSGLATCLKYHLPRDPTCELFPTTASDLSDRDLILPGTKCGYSFSDREEGGC